MGLAALACAALLTSCSGKAGDRSQFNTTPSPSDAIPTLSPEPVTPGRGGGGIPFESPIELARKFNVPVFAPEGVPLHGGVTASVDAKGNLDTYGVGLFNGFGSLYVAGPAPSSPSGYRTAADDDPSWQVIRKTSATVHAQAALLIEQASSYQANDRWYRLLWAQDGSLLQVLAPKKVGLAAVTAVAEATRLFDPATIASANIIVDNRPNPAGNPIVYDDPAAVARMLGVTVFRPPAYKQIVVVPDPVTGKPGRWIVDVDDVVSIYLVESIPDDSQLIRAPAGAPTPDVSHPSAGDTTATYVRSTSSTLYFTREGSIVAIRDRSGKSDAAALQAVASALSEYPPGTPSPGTCCALQLDMDSTQPGVQSSLNVSGPQDITVGVVFGDNAGELNAFNFTLVYDDTRLTPIATGAGGTTDGNPDFDDAALGNGWTCSLPSGSATPDTDPATGPGHGVAFLSCFTTGAPASIAAETEVATLRLRVAASGTSNVVIREAAFFHPEQIEIGSCQPVISVGIACVEGTVTAP